MKIAIGSDHGGYGLKEIVYRHLTEKGLEVTDFGAHNEESVDYPDYAKSVAEAVAAGKYDLWNINMWNWYRHEYSSQ